MNKVSIGVLALVVGVIIGAAVVNVSSGKLGGVTIEDETFKGDVAVEGAISAADLTATDDLVVTDNATINGGTLNVTSANTATSTAVVGCVQTYATSTATAVKLTLGVTGSTATTTFYGGTSKGIVYWEYGTCPNL